jgi:hypothetical protein
LLLLACTSGSDDEGTDNNSLSTAGTQSSMAGQMATAGTSVAGQAAAGVSGAAAGAGQGAGQGAGMDVPAAGMDAAGAAGAGMPQAGAGMAQAGTGATAGTGAPPFNGPVDGDPNKPMFAVPGVPCGAPSLSFAGVPQQNMVDIGGRGVFVAYPCVNEGAAVTFFLFIHGTLGEGMKIPFTMTNFPIHQKVDSDNFIVVTPEAVGTQWGNGDGGVDLPHLHAVIDWVYETFGEKLSIRSMWASGGSWGAAYLSTFACDPIMEGRLSGVRMVVGGGCPRCSNNLACIVAQQELDRPQGEAGLTDAEEEMRGSMYLDSWASMHGCDAKMGPTMISNIKHWEWPNCDPGYVHSYYLAPGAHADRWDDPMYVDFMTAQMKAIEQ